MARRPAAVMNKKRQGSSNPCDAQERLADLARGLSHPLRVEIIRMLANKPSDSQCICADIVEALPLAQSTVSQHLRVLKETGWITGKAHGTSMCYCLAGGVLETYRNLLEQVIIYNKNMEPSTNPCLENLLGKTRRRRGERNVRSD
jgi:DNA-binding transcriptional ArsR family regulator